MKNARIFLAVVVFIFMLSGCSNTASQEFVGGEYYVRYLISSKGTPLYTFVFQEDGFGVVLSSDGEQKSDFTWTQEENAIYTSSNGYLASTCFYYVDGYLVSPMNAFDGDIPNGDTFKTTVTHTISADTTVTMEFKKDGTVIQTLEQEEHDDQTIELVYIRDGNLLVTNSSNVIPDNLYGTRAYITWNGTLYSNPLEPVK